MKDIKFEVQFWVDKAKIEEDWQNVRQYVLFWYTCWLFKVKILLNSTLQETRFVTTQKHTACLMLIAIIILFFFLNCKEHMNKLYKKFQTFVQKKTSAMSS
jgi:uncharacterized protein YacL